MNQLWKRLDQSILQFGGKIDKHISDAVMALFGTPSAKEDDSERAILAALAMQKEIKAFFSEINQKNPQFPEFEIRIGIHTGLVSLGRVGQTQEYTAMGGTVNLASRLEEIAPKGEILISHNAYSHVRGLFTFQKLEPIQIKGKTSLIQTYLIKLYTGQIKAPWIGFNIC